MPTIHPEMVKTLCKPGETILAEMTPLEAHILHMVVGVSGEAGELLDAIKKMVIKDVVLYVEQKNKILTPTKT